MTADEELSQIEKDVEDLGAQIFAKQARALEIMRGRIGVVRGKRFRIERVSVIVSGARTCRLYYGGPVLTKTGADHARQRESHPMILIDKIEPR